MSVSLFVCESPSLRLCDSGSHQDTAGCAKARQGERSLMFNHCPECDALEAKLKTADAIFSSAPSDQASIATRLHSDVLNMMNAEICDVKAKYEQSFSEAQVYVDRVNALMAVQSVWVFLCCALTFQSLLASKRGELSKMSLDDMHPSQVHVLLQTFNIASDVNVLVTNSVTGSLLKTLASEGDMKEILAINEGGNCTRAAQLVRRMTSGKGIPKPVNIYNDGKDRDPSTWSVQQLAAHLAESPVLKDAHGVFVQHKLAGDVINDMNEPEVAKLMKLPLAQHLAFKSEITSLRKTIRQQSLSGRLCSLCFHF